jgi:hypothetical protein
VLAARPDQIGVMTATPATVLLDAADAADAAAYCGVRPATLRVWRHRYGLTPHWDPRRRQPP